MWIGVLYAHPWKKLKIYKLLKYYLLPQCHENVAVKIGILTVPTCFSQGLNLHDIFLQT